MNYSRAGWLSITGEVSQETSKSVEIFSLCKLGLLPLNKQRE